MHSPVNRKESNNSSRVTVYTCTYVAIKVHTSPNPTPKILPSHLSGIVCKSLVTWCWPSTVMRKWNRILKSKRLPITKIHHCTPHKQTFPGHGLSRGEFQIYCRSWLPGSDNLRFSGQVFLIKCLAIGGAAMLPVALAPPPYPHTRPARVLILSESGKAKAEPRALPTLEPRRSQ